MTVHPPSDPMSIGLNADRFLSSGPECPESETDPKANSGEIDVRPK